MFGGSAGSNGFGKYSSNLGGFGSVLGLGQNSDEANNVFSSRPFGSSASSSVFGGSAGGMTGEAKQGMQFKNGDSTAMNEFGKASWGTFSGRSPSFAFGAGGFGLGRSSTSVVGGNQSVPSMPVQDSSTFSFGRVASNMTAAWDPAFRSSSSSFGGSSGTKSHVGGFTSGSCLTSNTSRKQSFIPESTNFLPHYPVVASGKLPSFTGGTFTFGSKHTPFGVKNTSNVPAFGNTGNAVAPACGLAFDGVSEPPSSCMSGNSTFRSGFNFNCAGKFSSGGGNKKKSYSPTAVLDNTGKKTAEKLQSKSAMPDYLSKSHEELRWYDYQCNRGYSAVQPNENIVSEPTGNNMPCTTQPFPSFSVEKLASTAPNVHEAKGFGTFTVPCPTVTTQPIATLSEVTYKSRTSSPNCCPASRSTVWWAVPQSAKVGMPTTYIPVVPSPTGQSPSSFSFYPERAKPVQETKFVLGKDPLQTSQGLIFSTGLLDGASIPSQPDFNKISSVSSAADVQPPIIAKPFGTPIWLLHSESVPFVQQGISSMPIVSKPTPVKTSSLLTCRHLSQSRIKLTARKPPPINDGPKVPFFYSKDEIPCATKGHSWIIARDSPKAWITNPAPVRSPTNNPDTTLPANSECTSRIIPENLYERVIKEDKTVTAGSNTTVISQTSEEHGTLQLPKLPQSDYYTKPSMEELAAKEKAEPGFLSHVKDFVVGRHGYGDVKFKGETDVRQLDMESILKFSNREVTVYMDESTKPPIGHGLNKPAEITLLNIKVLGKKTGRQYSDREKADKYKEMLVQKAKDNGAKFISYDPVAGEWKFSVPHFSCICLWKTLFFFLSTFHFHVSLLQPVHISLGNV